MKMLLILFCHALAFLISIFFVCPPEVLWSHKLLDEALHLRVPQHHLPEGPVERSTAWKRPVPNPKNCLLFRLYRATPPSEPLLWFMMEITRKLQNNQAELNANMHQNDDSSRPWPHTLYGRPGMPMACLFLITTVQYGFWFVCFVF